MRPPSRALRRLSHALLAALVAAPIGSASVGARAEASGSARYPDLKTLAPRDLRFDRADVTADLSGVFHNVLRFSNDNFNAGEAPLIVNATINPSTLSGPSTQRVMNSDGTYTDYPLDNDVYWHEAHHHYHFDNWGDFQLWTKSSYDGWIASGRTVGGPLYEGAKTTSCILDEEFVTSVPNAVYPGPYRLSGCDAGTSWQIQMGLSPGWGDTYDWYRQEQWVDLGQNTLANGTYVLRSVADPLGVIYESANKSDPSRERIVDNEARTTFVVSGGVIQDSDAPTGTVSINHVDQVTTSANVSIDVVGRDDVSGPGQFQLSNNGTSFKTFSYTSSGSVPTTVAWDLTDPTAGGTPGDGIHTVYAKVKDVTGKWGPTFTDTIALRSNGLPTPTGPYAQQILADGPMGYWRLDETSGTTAADRAGSSPGVYRGGTQGTPSLLTSDDDPAASFSGSLQSVEVASTPPISLASTVSVEAWIKPASLPAAGAFASIVSKAESYSLHFNGPRLEFTIMRNGRRERLQAPAGAVAPNTRYHVVGTYDGGTQRLYRNGALVASAALQGAITTNTNSLYIASWNGRDEFFHGSIDEPAVYAVALSATQVSNHYISGTNPPPPPPPAPLSISRSGTGNGNVTSAPAGLNCGATCSASFPPGTSITLTATPAAGSTFNGWTGGGCTGTGPCILTLGATTSIDASFAAVPTALLTISRSGTANGTITSAPAGITCGATCTTSFAQGTSITLRAIPAAGSTFTGWFGGTCAGTGPCTLTLSANTSVDAGFAPVPTSPLTVRRHGNGTVTSTPRGLACGAICAARFKTGTSIRLDAVAKPGSIFTGWSGARCKGRGACKVTLKSAVTVRAMFKRRAIASPRLAAGPAARRVSVDRARSIATAFDNGLHRAYVTGRTGRGSASRYGVTVVDTRSWRVIGRISTGGSGPGSSSIAVNPVTHLVYVTTAVFEPTGVRGSITVINGRTNKVVRSIPTGPGPKAVAVNAKTNRVYVTAQTGTDGAGAIVVIDGASHRVIATVPMGPYGRYFDNPFGIAVNARTNTVYATNPLQGAVYILDGTTNAIVRSIAIGGTPAAIAVNERANTVAVSGARNVTVMDGRSGAVKKISAGNRSPRIDARLHNLIYAATHRVTLLAANTHRSENALVLTTGMF